MQTYILFWNKIASLSFIQGTAGNLFPLPGFIFSLDLIAVVQLISHVWLFWDPMGCSPPSSFICGISHARILGWVALSFSGGSSWPRDLTLVSCVSCSDGSGEQLQQRPAKPKMFPIWPFTDLFAVPSPRHLRMWCFTEFCLLESPGD